VTVNKKFSTKNPSLSFKVGVGKKASELTGVTVELPSGLKFVEHGSAKHPKITGVSVNGAKVKSLKISGGHLVITLKKAVRSFTVKLTTVLSESSALESKIQAGKVKSLRLTVVATNAKRRHYTVHELIKRLG